MNLQNPYRANNGVPGSIPGDRTINQPHVFRGKEGSSSH